MFGAGAQSAHAGEGTGVLALGSSRGSLAIVFARGSPNPGAGEARVCRSRGLLARLLGFSLARERPEPRLSFLGVSWWNSTRHGGGVPSGRGVARRRVHRPSARGGEERGDTRPPRFPDGPARPTHGDGRDLLGVKQGQPVRWLGDRAVGGRGEWPRCAVPLSTGLRQWAAKLPPTRACDGLRRARRVADVLPPGRLPRICWRNTRGRRRMPSSRPSRCHWNEGPRHVADDARDDARRASTRRLPETA
jgi:hypothetical protein